MMKFWPFASRGARDESIEAPKPPPKLDFAKFAVNDVAIKLWLPVKLIVALDAVSANTLASRPDVLRRLLFEHAYGRVAFEQLVVWKKNLDEMPTPPDDFPGVPILKASPARGPSITHLGKSTEDYKLWLPKVLKQALDALAQKDGLGLSDYIRKVLVRLLLGEHAYAEWRAVVGDVPEV